MYGKKRVYRRKPTNKRRPKRGKKTSRSLVTKSQLYRAIRRNIETKIAENQYGFTTFNSGISSAGDFITLLPSIAAGNGDAARIGNSVKPLRLVIQGYICFNTDAAAGLVDAGLYGARLFCFQQKANRFTGSSSPLYNLLQNGSSTTTFSGTAMNMCQPVNKESYIWYADKKMVMKKNYGYTDNATPTSAIAITSFDNSMFRPFRIVLTQKQLPSVLTYDDSVNSTYPMNFYPILALGYANLLNKSADTITTRLGMQFCSTLYYEDA